MTDAMQVGRNHPAAARSLELMALGLEAACIAAARCNAAESS